MKKGLELITILEFLSFPFSSKAEDVNLVSLVAFRNPYSAEEEINQTPKFIFSQSYPNPVKLPVEIHYSISNFSSVKLNIYDIKGQLVKTLVNTSQQPGNYSVNWDGKNQKENNA